MGCACCQSMRCLKVCVVQSTCAAGMATYLVNVVHGGLGSGGGRHQVAAHTAHTAQTKPTRQAKWGTQLIRTMLQSGARGRVSEGVGPTPHVLLGIVRVAHDPGTPLLSVPNLGVTDNTTQHTDGWVLTPLAGDAGTYTHIVPCAPACMTARHPHPTS